MWDAWKLSGMLLTFFPPRSLNILSLLITMAYWVLTMHKSQVQLGQYRLRGVCHNERGA